MDNSEVSFDNSQNESYLTIDEFANFSSPRYFRLIFPQFKPQTKNGDLLAALGELGNAKILTNDSNWDHIKLTKKGNQYKKIIKNLIDSNQLYAPDANGLFDYRSDQGRRVIVELINFLSAKFDFNEYFRYLNLPIFDEERNKEWIEIFGRDSESSENFDYSTEEGKNNLLNLLKKRAKKYNRKFNSINKNITQQARSIKINITLIKKFLKNLGFNRPGPLLNHFETNNENSKIFIVKDRNFYVNFAELNKTKGILDEIISINENDENKWLSDYFNLLKIPTNLFGFQKSEFTFSSAETSKEVSIFLNLAAEGPKIFAGQFSLIDGLGELSLIHFPINNAESFVIYCVGSDLIYYFTIPTGDCSYIQEINPVGFPDYPEIYRTSRKRFGKLLTQSYTLAESMENTLDTTDSNSDDLKSKEEQKLLEEEIKIKKNIMKQKIDDLSHYTASFFTICQVIAEKFTPNIKLHKAHCIYEEGIVSFHYLYSDTILTQIKRGKVEFKAELRSILKKIEDSMEEILNFEHDD